MFEHAKHAIDEQWSDPASDLALDLTCPDCGQAYSGAQRGGGHCHGGKYGGCCQSFRSQRTADAHRTGPYNPAGQRRCLTPDEMRAKGWTRDDAGMWRAAPPQQPVWPA
jgi:hypothetical protein